MAVAPVVVQSSLCFLVKKFGKMSVRQLKSMVIDFYDVEELNAATQQLLIDAGNMNLDISLPHIPGRRDGDLKAVHFTLLTFLDENLKSNLLPCYVTDNPDAVPSGRLYDGDLSALMKIMQKMVSEIRELKIALAAIASAHSRAETRVQGSHQSSANSTSVINKTAKSTGAQLLPTDRMCGLMKLLIPAHALIRLSRLIKMIGSLLADAK